MRYFIELVFFLAVAVTFSININWFNKAYREIFDFSEDFVTADGQPLRPDLLSVEGAGYAQESFILTAEADQEWYRSKVLSIVEYHYIAFLNAVIALIIPTRTLLAVIHCYLTNRDFTF